MFIENFNFLYNHMSKEDFKNFYKDLFFFFYINFNRTSNNYFTPLFCFQTFLFYIYTKFKLSINCLHFTLILGFLFERIQWFEYLHCSFSISDGIYGTTFFLLTGLHGFHVLVGVFLLLFCLMSINYDFYFNW